MFTTIFILFLYGMAGFGVAAGLFLRVESKLARAAGRIPRAKYWGIIFTLMGLSILCFLIIAFNNGTLIFGLGVFFGTAVLTLLYFYFLYLSKRNFK